MEIQEEEETDGQKDVREGQRRGRRRLDAASGTGLCPGRGAGQDPVRVRHHAVRSAGTRRGIDHRVAVQAVAEAGQRCRRHLAEEVQQEGADRPRGLRRPGQAGRAAQAHRAPDPGGQGRHDPEPIRHPHESGLGAGHQQGPIPGDPLDLGFSQALRAGAAAPLRVLAPRPAERGNPPAVGDDRRPQEGGQDQGTRGGDLCRGAARHRAAWGFRGRRRRRTASRSC